MKIVPTIRLLCLFILVLLLNGCAIWRGTPTEPILPEDAGFYTQEGDNFLNGGNYESAINSYTNALKKDPKAIETRRKLAETYFRLGKNEPALQEFAKILEIEPDYIHARNYKGFIYSNENKWNDAINEFEASLKINPDDIYALGHLGLAYKMVGRIEDARKVLLRASELDPEMDDPESKNVHNYLGLLYKGEGRYEDALVEYRRTLEHFPDDTTAQNRIGEIYEAMAKYLDAFSAYKKTLRLDSENAYAKQRLEALQQAGIYYVEPVDVVKDDVNQIIASAPDASQYPDAGAVVLLDKLSYEITDGGSIRYTVHWLIKIFNDRGIAQYGELAFPFNATFQNIGVNMARTILPDGTEVEAAEDAFHDITLPGLSEYNLYSDVMLKIVNMPALEPGVIIEYKATVEDAAESREKSWIWGSMAFQGIDPIINAKCVLRMPKDISIQWRSSNGEIDPVITEDEKTFTYVWVKKNIPPIEIEEAMPPLGDVVPGVYFSSSDSWDEVYNWYKDLAKPQEMVDGIHQFNIGIDFQSELDEGKLSESLLQTFESNKISLSSDARLSMDEEGLKWSIVDGKKIYSIEASEDVLSVYDDIVARKVNELIAGKKSKEEKIKAIYEFVASKIRYVAIELGQSAYQPNTPVEVLTFRYGDCKDKSTLLVAMLRDIGVKSYQGLLSLAPGKAVDLDIPSVAQFSHVIVAIPNEDNGYIWLDATASTCKYGDLPSGDQGRDILIIGDEKGEFVKTPVYPSEANKISSMSEFSIQEDGSIAGWEKTIANGQADMYLKMLYRLTNSDQRKRSIESSLNQRYPGVMVNEITISDLYNLDEPIEIKVGFSCPDYVQKIGNLLVFPVPSEDFSSYATLVSDHGAREHEFWLDYNMMIKRELKLIIPEGYKAMPLPESLSIKDDFGMFSRSYEIVDDRNITYSAMISIDSRNIPTSKYNNMKKIIETASREDRGQIILGKIE